MTPPPASAGLAIVPRDRAAQSELRIGHLATGRNTPDYPALLVMNALLGGQFVSRVNLKLREEKGFTYGARTGFDWRRGATPFVLQASVHTAATADAIRDSLGELQGIRGARPPTGAELMLAKASLTRGYPRNFETAQQVAKGERRHRGRRHPCSGAPPGSDASHHPDRRRPWRNRRVP
jgi:predicted Zn-dependent peptidase